MFEDFKYLIKIVIILVELCTIMILKKGIALSSFYTHDRKQNRGNDLQSDHAHFISKFIHHFFHGYPQLIVYS